MGHDGKNMLPETGDLFVRTVLVTGATGFVGSALLKALSSSQTVQARGSLRRPGAPLPDCPEAVLVGDLEPETDWSAALEGVSIVVHAAARVHLMKDTSADPLVEFRRVNVAGTMRLARQAAEAGVERFVFISSIKVNGDETLPGQSYSDADLPAPVDPYGVSKLEAENQLLQLMAETGMEVVILRPPLVYGPGVKANFLRLLKLTQKGFLLPFALFANRRSMIYVGNLVSAVLLCMKHPEAAGEIFLICDGEDVSTPGLMRQIAASMGRKLTLTPIPPILLKVLGSLAGKRAEVGRLTDSLCIDSRKIRDMLEWRTPYTLEEGIQKTVDWYMESD